MKAVLTRVLVAAILGATATASFAAGQPQPRLAPLPIDDVLNAPTLAPFSSITFAPDSRTAAFTVIDRKRAATQIDPFAARSTGVWWKGQGADLYVVDVTTGKQRNITNGSANEFVPSWSPDGQALAFISDRGDGIAHLWIWNTATGQRRQVGQFMLPVQVETFPWTSDSRHVIVKLLPEGLSGADYATRVLGPRGQKKSVEVFSFDPTEKGAAPTTDQVNVDAWLGDLALVDIDSGAVRRLSKGSRIGTFRMSPDRRSLAWIVVKGYEKAGSQQFIGSLVVCDLSNGATRMIADDLKLADYAGDASFAWSATSDALAWQAGGPVGASDAVFAADLQTGAVKQIATGEPLDDPGAGNVYWDGDGKHVYFTRKHALWRAATDGAGASVLVPDGARRVVPLDRQSGQLWMADARHGIVKTLDQSTKRAGFARVDLASGAVTSIIEEDKRYGGYAGQPSVTPDGRSIAYMAEDSQHAPEWRIASSDGRPSRQISTVAPVFGQYALGHVEVIEWRGVDGNTLRGALMYPAGYQRGKRYPMVVKVYGGSDVSNSLHQFGFASAPVDNLQLLATRGFAVLFADSHLNLGTPMVDLMKSVLPGVDRAVELGVADPDRIGITGHSYGGYSTLALIVQTTRFKAAVASASIGNLPAAFGALRPDGTNYLMTWAETGQGRMGGNPWDQRARYIENSPVFYLDRVTTPLLLVNGGDDIAPTLADETFSDLRRLGKRVEYARYPGEDHWEGTWSLANQRDYLTRFVGWFERYLKAP